MALFKLAVVFHRFVHRRLQPFRHFLHLSFFILVMLCARLMDRIVNGCWGFREGLWINGYGAAVWQMKY
ncbi:hypothetical protein AM274_12695 [Pseudomonas nunensis]|nr:hypothetical protein AM274_12695 [Pseudomonas nunensis]